MINGHNIGMQTSKSDFGFNLKASKQFKEQNNQNEFLALSTAMTAKSMKALKVYKSPHNSLSKINGKNVVNGINDEQNNENIDEYCEKLRYQQAKMFWNSSNHEIRNRVYKKFKPNSQSNNVESKNCVAGSIEAHKIFENRCYMNKTEVSIENHIPSKNEEIQNANFDNSNDDGTKLELMVCPKINDVIDGFERSSKRWTSMYALRDSFRNLTSCVSNKTRYTKKK